MWNFLTKDPKPKITPTNRRKRDLVKVEGVETRQWRMLRFLGFSWPETSRSEHRSEPWALPWALLTGLASSHVPHICESWELQESEGEQAQPSTYWDMWASSHTNTCIHPYQHSLLESQCEQISDGPSRMAIVRKVKMKGFFPIVQ